MHLVNDPINPCLRVFYDRCSERFVVNSCRVALWPLLFFSVLFVMTVVVPLAAFLRFKEGLFFDSIDIGTNGSPYDPT